MALCAVMLPVGMQALKWLLSLHELTLFKKVRLTTLNGAEILSLGQWEACEALRDAFSAAHNWSKGSSGRDARGFSCGVGRRCAVIFLDEADALLAR